MSNIVNNFSSTIITIFKDVTERYESNVELIKQTEEELQDIFHEIELSSSKDMYSGYKLYKEIRELRIKRRQAKTENELLEEMYNYLKEPQNQKFRNKISQIQGNAAKIAKTQEGRTYTPRRRTDLTITEKHCEANIPFEDMLREFKKEKVKVVKGKLRK